MSTVEQQLTELLERQAAGTAPHPGLLGGSLRRSRRRRLRRQVLAVTAAVAVALGGLGLTRLPYGSPTSLTTAATVHLSDAKPLVSTFPYTATYLPPGTAPGGTTSLYAIPGKDPYDGPVLREAWAAVGRPNDRWLSLHLSGGVTDATPTSTSTTTVRGHVATVKNLGSFSVEEGPSLNETSLSWEEAPGHFIEISYDGGGITLAQARAFAEGLTLKDDTRASWITMRTTLADGELAVWGKGTVIIQVPPFSDNKDPDLSVFGCKHGTFLPDTGMKPTDLSGHTYLFKQTPSASLAIKEVSPGTDLVVDFHGGAWTVEDMGQVLDGLGWTGPTPPAPTIPNTC